MDQDGCSQLGKLSQLPKNSMLNELIISEAKYDLVIRITEDAGGWISLHKMLLALKAPKLLEALENDGNKGMDEEEIEWVKWPSKISLISFKKFLAWVYNGTPGSETTEEDVSALLQIAKDYEIFELAEWCEQMSVPMTTSTIMPLMHQGLVSGNDELVTKILYALASDQEEILPLNPFVKLGLRHQAEERAANAIHTANIFDALFRF
ncbi:hypothetical protein Fcan01_25581 [Folsomia candida]|uniref:BTB domain-containing protein n=1 Tax=Folsomia candida TaxID=158441 RepID=A0A226D3M2_FOLCA|nr:hypothetical protein Fcan01_25581 [Folsomia candida]